MSNKRQMAIEIATKEVVTKTRTEIVELIAQLTLDHYALSEIESCHNDYFPDGCSKGYVVESLGFIPDGYESQVDPPFKLGSCTIEEVKQGNKEWLKVTKEEFDKRN